MAKKRSKRRKKTKGPPKANYAGNVILHLSDLHFEDDPKQTVKRTNLLNGLIDCFKNGSPEWKPTVICITGDIAHKAKVEGYKIAEDWINKLLRGLKIKRKNIVLCPGNHDVDEDKAKKIERPKNTIDANESFSTFQIPSHYEDLFSGFINLCDNLKLDKPVYGDFSSYLFGVRRINYIHFLVCNSCWFFKNTDEDKNGMWLGYPLFESLESKIRLLSKRSSNLIIALMHHPERKLHEDETFRCGNNTPTWSYIREIAELILTGDLHSLPIRSYDTINCGPLLVGRDVRNVFCLIKLEDGRCHYRYYIYDQSRPINKWEPEGPIYPKNFRESENLWNAIMDKRKPREVLKILEGPCVFKKKQRITKLAKIYKKREPTPAIDKQLIIDSIRAQIIKAQRNIEMLEYEKSFIIADGIVNKLKETESLLPDTFLAETYSDLANIEITRVNWLNQMKGMPKDFSRVKEFYRKAKEYYDKG